MPKVQSRPGTHRVALPWRQRTTGYAADTTYVDATPTAAERYYAVEAYDELHRASAKTVVTLARFTPVALADSAVVAHNTPMVVDALGNDSDKDGDPLVVTAFTQGQHGTVTTNGSRLIYTPQPGYTGSDSFGYTVSDEKEGTAAATVTVQVQPAPPTLSINDVTVNEAAGEALFTLTVDRILDVNIDVTVQTSNGSATQPSDYRPISDTVTIKSGTTTAFFAIPITDDQVAERDETFTVTLSQAVHATLADSQGVATIVNDDAGEVVAAERLYLPLINR